MSQQKNTLFPERISPILATVRDSVIVIACSGGVDSMVLLDCVRMNNDGIIVAHIHHWLRDTADRDEHIVRDYCEKYSLTLEVLHADVQKEAKKTKTTIEECARNIRKAWLEKIREKYHASSILTAHHSDDQVETILYRIIKWTSITGLVGIQEVSGVYLRPLLHVKKTELLSYARVNEVPFGHDETNDDITIPRNLIRHTILPELEKINPEGWNALIRLSKNALELKRGFDEFFDAYREWISYDTYVKFPIAFQHELIRYWYEQTNHSTHGLSLARMEEFDRFLSTRRGGKKEFGKMWLSKKSGKIYLT